MRLTRRTVLSDAFLLIIPLKISWPIADDAERSWESAVDIDAARIAQRKIPARNAGYISFIDSEKTAS